MLRLNSAGGAETKQAADERKAKFEAAAKALQDEQDKSIAEENARVMKEYEELISRGPSRNFRNNAVHKTLHADMVSFL